MLKSEHWNFIRVILRAIWKEEPADWWFAIDERVDLINYLVY